ncbi:MAG: hypothetical protein KIT73_17230 [Burkholderiales bacterium]|nr:hypothetical protein [Burkholderiales bacterium]
MATIVIVWNAMNRAFALLAAFSLAMSVHAQEQKPDAPLPGVQRIAGKWQWTRAENSCTEVYDFHADGTLAVISGLEKTDNTYTIASAPDANGFYVMQLKTVKDYGGKDCADVDSDSTHQENTVFILFHPEQPLHVMCMTPSPATCFGPLVRIQE